LAKLEASAPGNEPLQCWLRVDATASEQDIEAQKTIKRPVWAVLPG
jgi:hypothetical protein